LASGEVGGSWCYVDEGRFSFLNGRGEAVLHFEKGRLVRWGKNKPVRYYIPGEETGRHCKVKNAGGNVEVDDWMDCSHGVGGIGTEPEIKVGTGVWTHESLDCEWDHPCPRDVGEPGDHLYVARNYVSFWLEHPTSSARKASVDPGQRMTLLGQQCQWCHVEDDFGTPGWIACVLLEVEAMSSE